MSSLPLVSIIIPVYNREEIVCRSIDSALSQTYGNIEIIISDNASTDGTWGVLKNYASKDKRIKIYRNENNLGPVKNWEQCLNHVSGEYIKILWSDDSMDSSFIEKAIPFIKDRSVGFVYSTTKIEEFGLSKKYYRYGRSNYYSTRRFIEDHLIQNEIVPLSPGCALFRSDDVREALLINIPNKYELDFARYGAGNDLLIFLRTCLKYRRFFFIDEMLSVFYGGADSLTEKYDLGQYYLYSKLYFVENYGKEFRNSFFTLLSCGSNRYLIKGSKYKLNFRLVIKRIVLKIVRKFVKPYIIIK